MSIKVERRVDTVIMEMDVSTAEKLALVLDRVQDNTTYHSLDALEELWRRLTARDEVGPIVRWPSKLTAADGSIYLFNNPDRHRE